MGNLLRVLQCKEEALEDIFLDFESKCLLATIVQFFAWQNKCNLINFYETITFLNTLAAGLIQAVRKKQLIRTWLSNYAANKLGRTFDQHSPIVKALYCMPMYACQLWSNYTQTSMKHLHVAYNNAYQIMHYIPRNVSACPHQVRCCVRTFDALLRNHLYRFFIRYTYSSNFYPIDWNVWCFLQIFIFPQLFNTLYDDDQLQ